MGLKNRGMCHDVFLLGQSLSIAASEFAGLGSISMLASLFATTYCLVTPAGTFALFKEMCSLLVIPVAFHMHFETMGRSQVSMAHTTDTKLTNWIYRDRLLQPPHMHMRASAPGRHVFGAGATRVCVEPAPERARGAAGSAVLAYHMFAAASLHSPSAGLEAQLATSVPMRAEVGCCAFPSRFADLSAHDLEF